MQRSTFFSSATLLGLLLFMMPMSAQEHETLFDAPVEHGGFGALVTKVTPIRGELGIMVGGYGGWLINHRFMIGAGGYGLSNNVRASAGVEVNVTTWFRIAAGGSYHFVGGIDELKGIESTDLAGPSGTLSLKFGKF